MNKLSTLAALVALSIPAFSHAQFSTGEDAPAPKQAWEQFNLSKTKTMTLSFRNANVDMVLDAFSRASGITIVRDPLFKDPISLTTAKLVKLAQAFEILNATISLRGFEMKKQGSLIIIQQKKREEPRMNFDPAMFTQNQDKPELRVYKIKHAAASEVARVVNEVFVPAGSSGGMSPFGGMNFGGMTRGRGGNNRFGGFNPMQFMTMGQGQDDNSARASSDDFSNTVIVNAKKNTHSQVNDLIKEIDQPTQAPQTTKVFPLQYANAQDLVSVVQNVLTSNAPTGRGTRPQNNQGGGFFGFFGGNNNRQGQSSVNAETRTNSLIVTATEENVKIVEGLVTALDKDLPVSQTTFVVPLLNARADEVATLMQNAFGQRQNQNRNTNQNRTNQSTRTTNSNTRNNQGQRTNSLIPINDPTAKMGDAMALDLQNTGQDEELRTQFFFGGGGQNNNNQNRNNNQNTLARGADGRLVNTRDLTGQVTIIPDNNTNSLIVVGDPESYRLLQGIIDQLDRVPEQVMIETIILEASLTKNDKLGIEWSLAHGKFLGDNALQGTGSTNYGLNTTTAPEGFNYTLGGGNLQLFLNALRQDDRFQVLSTPRIFTSNNAEAEINISQSVPYVLSTREDANGNLSYNYAFQDVGIVLNVTPRITANGYVTLDVVQTANDLQGFTTFNAPIVNQRQADTKVTIKDGETMILGGIMRKTVTSRVKKLPLLGDIPFLGDLFKSKSTTEEKTELIVLLTPKIVRTSEEAKKLMEEEQNGYTPTLLKELSKEKGTKPAKPVPAPVKTEKGSDKGKRQ